MITAKTKMVIASSMLIFAVSVFGIFKYREYCRVNKLNNDNSQVLIQDRLINDHKIAITPLVEKAKQEKQAIQPLKSKAQTSKQKLEAQIQVDSPETSEPLHELATDALQGVSDQEEVSAQTQTALNASEDVVASQETVIQDQTSEITTLKIVVNESSKEVEIQTHRKVLWRDCAFVSTSLLIIRLLVLHF